MRADPPGPSETLCGVETRFPGLRVPLLSLAPVGRKLDGVAIGALVGLIAVQQRLNPVLPGRDLGQAADRVAESPAVHHHRLSRRPPLDVHPERQLAGRAVHDLEARLRRVILGEHEDQPAVEGIRTPVSAERHRECGASGSRAAERGERRNENERPNRGQCLAVAHGCLPPPDSRCDSGIVPKARTASGELRDHEVPHRDADRPDGAQARERRPPVGTRGSAKPGPMTLQSRSLSDCETRLSRFSPLDALHAERRYAVSLRFRAAVPTGGRRSKPSPRFFSVGDVPFAALRAAVPTGGRRSKPSPRFFSVGDVPFAALWTAVPTGGRCSRPSPRFSPWELRSFAPLRGAVPV